MLFGIHLAGMTLTPPALRQRSACAYVHVCTWKVAASLSSENFRICHFQQGLGSHQDYLIYVGEAQQAIFSLLAFKMHSLTFLYLYMRSFIVKTNSKNNIRITSDSLPRIRTQAVLETVLLTMFLSHLL